MKPSISLRSRSGCQDAAEVFSGLGDAIDEEIQYDTDTANEFFGERF
jgi:hypothetical protein